MMKNMTNGVLIEEKVKKQEEEKELISLIKYSISSSEL